MRVGIVGLGYVGLPLAVEFAEGGDEVTGLDVSAERVERLGESISDIEDIPSERVAAVAERLTATTDPAALRDCEAILICVPTPLSAGREPDLTYVESAGRSVAEVLEPGTLVVLESTTYPGTTRERLAPILAAGSGLTPGDDFALAFSPERIDPGRADHTLRNTPKVVGGLTAGCTRRAAELYARVCDEVVEVSSPEVAEMTKLLENVYRAVNIALVNEIAQLTDRMGISIWEVVEAAATKPFGFKRFDPGPGMGGHCLPVDPFYLSYKARQLDSYTEFVELAGKLNQTQPHWCVQLVERALNERSMSVRGARILILGVSYKEGVGDLRESPALKILAELAELGAETAYADAYVPELPALGLTASELEPALADCDLAVIVTAHPGVDWFRVVESAPLVLDLRGVTRGVEAANVRRLGEGF